jgi:hypothetical protein
MKNERRRELRLRQSSTVGKKEKMGACYQEYASSNTLTADLLFKAKAREAV